MKEKNKSMTDIAYVLMSRKKRGVSFYKLWTEVSQIMGYDNDEAKDKISVFYTNLTLDGRFIFLKDNFWDLQSRHTKQAIDLSEIYSDEAEEIDIEIFDPSELVIDDEIDDITPDSKELEEFENEFEDELEDEY